MGLCKTGHPVQNFPAFARSESSSKTAGMTIRLHLAKIVCDKMYPARVD